MSTHISNFGQFSRALEIFADRRGFVPEVGDQFDDYEFDADWKPDDEEWIEYTYECANALKKADAACEAWREWSQS